MNEATNEKLEGRSKPISLPTQIMNHMQGEANYTV